MPVDEKFLDAFSQASPEKQKQFLARRSPEEQLMLADAVKARRLVREKGQTGALGAGVKQGVTLGFGDELAGAAGALGWLVGQPESKGYTINGKHYTAEDTFGADKTDARDAYQQARDEARFENKALEDAYGKTYMAGNVLGGVATLAPGASLAKAAGLKGAKALFGAGATEGAIGGLGSSEADLTVGDAGNYGRAAVDTGIGAGFGVAATGIGVGLNKLATKATEKLRGVAAKKAEEQALKAVHGNLGAIKKLSPEKRQEVGRALLDEDVVGTNFWGVGRGTEDMAERAAGRAEQYNTAKEALFSELGLEEASRGINPVAAENIAERGIPEIEKIYNASARPIQGMRDRFVDEYTHLENMYPTAGQKEKILKNTWAPERPDLKAPAADWRKYYEDVKIANRGFEKVEAELAKKKEGLGLADLWREKQGYGELAKHEGPRDSTKAQEILGWRAMEGRLRDEAIDQAKRIDTPKAELLDKTIRKEHLMLTADKLLEQELARDLVRGGISLQDAAAAVAGASVGSAGAVAGFLGRKLLAGRGNATAAAILNKMSRKPEVFAQHLPRLFQAYKSSPADLEEYIMTMEQQ